MGMKTEIRVDCDGCGKRGPTTPTDLDAVRAVIVRGWLIDSVFDCDMFLCEACRKDTPPWWPEEIRKEPWRGDDDD